MRIRVSKEIRDSKSIKDIGRYWMRGGQKCYSQNSREQSRIYIY